MQTIVAEDRDFLVAERDRLIGLVAYCDNPPRVGPVEIGAARIELAAGERFAGPILDSHGGVAYYLVVMHSVIGYVHYEQAHAHGVGLGGRLPTPREVFLMAANLGEYFDSQRIWLDGGGGSGRPTLDVPVFDFGGNSLSLSKRFIKSLAVIVREISPLPPGA